MFRIYLFLKDETGDDYIGKIKFMCSPAEFSSFAGDLLFTGVADYLVDVGRNAGNKGPIVWKLWKTKMKADL